MKTETVPTALLAAFVLALPVAAQKPDADAAKAEKPAARTEKPAAKPEKPAAKAATKPSPAPSPAASAKPAASPAPATPAPSPAPPVTVVVQAPPPAAEPRADLVSGWIGLAILGVGGFFAWRALKSRGMTVTGAFRQVGVELPTEPVGGPAVAPARPQPAPLPPLPSLSDLPAAGPAPVVAPVATMAGPRLVGAAGDLALTGIVTVGREADNGIALPGDTTVSRRHARIEPRGDAWLVEDLGSSNGTFVNGQRIAAAQPLRPGDEVRFGSATFRFEA